jgi:predicted KAP-like P-loop ATPase
MVTVKLVVFIDDLDRCKPEKAAEIFEFIKVFLDIPGIVFILGLSDKVIERALRERYRYLEGDFSASDYVKKIVQLPVDIPLWVLTLGGEFGRNHVTTMHSPQAWGWG